ncbi:MAG: DUF4433 domain-containing protein [Candidatus Eisenbacteria bacterium]|nr:DUF4433 domain-containing protein [Candidatus Eisenbacteria bacterium]
MSQAPATPRIYHITHMRNLPGILAAGGLLSDATIMTRGGPTATIGLGALKQRRLTLPVHCHPGDHVGDYVPFYFCPRSVMLYVLHCANAPGLTYREGQGPIVHLEARLAPTLDWADRAGARWAFSLSNAGTAYCTFRKQRSQLDEIDWEAVANSDFRDRTVKEGKQAEFLLHEFFPWHLVERVGVGDTVVREQVLQVLQGTSQAPTVEVRADWYY